MADEADDPTCRICQCEDGELIAPCKCRGSVKWVHRSCLDEWRLVNDKAFRECSLCGFTYRVKSKDVKTSWWRWVPLIRDALIAGVLISIAIYALGFFFTKIVDTRPYIIRCPFTRALKLWTRAELDSAPPSELFADLYNDPHDVPRPSKAQDSGKLKRKEKSSYLFRQRVFIGTSILLVIACIYQRLHGGEARWTGGGFFVLGGFGSSFIVLMFHMLFASQLPRAWVLAREFGLRIMKKHDLDSSKHRVERNVVVDLSKSIFSGDEHRIELVLPFIDRLHHIHDDVTEPMHQDGMKQACHFQQPKCESEVCRCQVSSSATRQKQERSRRNMCCLL